MDTPPNAQSLAELPLYRRPAVRPMQTVGFRIYKDQKIYLESHYDGRASELVRALLDKYIRGEISDLKDKFK